MDDVDGLIAERIRAFTTAILHGDAVHRAWLCEAADNFIAGKPLPPPTGQGALSAMRERCEALEGALRGLMRSKGDARNAAIARAECVLSTPDTERKG